jgi:hypothetical protein
MKKSLIIISLILSSVFLIGFIGAGQYSYSSEFSSEFDSINILWNAQFKDSEGNIYNLSAKEFILNNERFVVFSSGKYLEGNYSTLIEPLDHPMFRFNEKEKDHFFGCLKGASFSEGFAMIFRSIFLGENPSLLLTNKEENEFEAEGRRIENTPGTAVFNLNQCMTNCEDKGNTRSFKSSCNNDCVKQYNCGTEIICSSFDSEGNCELTRAILSYEDSPNKSESKVFFFENFDEGKFNNFYLVDLKDYNHHIGINDFPNFKKPYKELFLVNEEGNLYNSLIDSHPPESEINLKFSEINVAIGRKVNPNYDNIEYQ